ncbi:MAG TPA: heparan-alpha-glucosaminide N-acetyltransferase domain-containing protein [Acidobacteriaceae bacterium]|jgi:uncharacterized membrane protein
MIVSAAAPASNEGTLTRRIAAVDLLRGLIMIVMALDHTRDFFSNAGVDATDPMHSWPALFFTRWITHLCAPGFVALAGTSIYLQRQRGRSKTFMAKRLVTRGLWLIFVEIAVVSFGLFFTYHFHFLQVIYAIGASMIVLAALQFLPTWCVAVYGFAIVLLHNLLDGVNANQLGHFSGLWKLLVAPGGFVNHGQLWILDVYPVLPWSGVMALGYAFGVVVLMPAARRRRVSVQMGALALTVFALLRFTNVYGDPDRFQHLGSAARTTMSFFDVTKYPPSLQYCCVTLGVLLLLFAVGDYALERRWMLRALGVVEVYGRVPFFYYVLHFYTIHILALLDVMFVMHTVHVTAPTPFVPGPPQATYSLTVVYLIWIAVVAALYLPCRWFAGVKARRREWWLSYL